MRRPLLPPKYVNVPSPLVYDAELSPALFHTWAQLRGLAWGKMETPELSMEQLARITGKSQSTLYGHLAALRDRGALRWRSAGRGALIVAFDDPYSSPASEMEYSDSGNPDDATLYSDLNRSFLKR